MKQLIIAFATICLFSGSAMAAEAIEGKWKTQSGETANIAKCGSDFCIKLVTGTHSGKQIGKLAGKGDSYVGEITDPANDKTYSGSGSINGNTLSMKGCVMKILCRTQLWSRL